MNQRNLLVLEALDRVRRKVLGDEPPEPEPPAPSGPGTWAAPAAVETLPAVVRGDARGGDQREARYACGAKIDLAGPERVYRVEVRQPGRLRARLFVDQGEAALRWLTAQDPASCTARARNRLDVQVKP